MRLRHGYDTSTPNEVASHSVLMLWKATCFATGTDYFFESQAIQEKIKLGDWAFFFIRSAKAFVCFERWCRNVAASGIMHGEI